MIQFALAALQKNLPMKYPDIYNQVAFIWLGESTPQLKFMKSLLSDVIVDIKTELHGSWLILCKLTY